LPPPVFWHSWPTVRPWLHVYIWLWYSSGILTCMVWFMIIKYNISFFRQDLASHIGKYNVSSFISYFSFIKIVIILLHCRFLSIFKAWWV
jgi:hypothetical protein